MKSPKSVAGRRTAQLVTLGLSCAIIAAAAIAIGIGAAQSDNPVPQEKQDIENQVAASHAAAVQFAKDHPELLPSKNPTVMPTVQPTSWSVGIIQSGSAPYSGADYTFKNEWLWDLDGNHVAVHAGAEGDFGSDPGRGTIVVDVTSMSLQPLGQFGGVYPAPPGFGSLDIVSYQGTLLTIQAATGQTFYFDAETRAFTDADGNPVPTDTPPPTPQPTPGGALPFPFPFPFPTDTAAATA